MIRIIEKPHDIMFSKNPIVFKFQNENNGNVIASSYAKSIIALESIGLTPDSTNIFGDNQSISLTVTVPYGTFSHSITFKFQPIGAELSTDATLREVYSTFKNSHILAPFLDFSLSNEVNKVSIIAIAKAKDFIPQWAITANSQDFTFSNQNENLVTDTEGVYKVYFEKRYNGGEWREVFTGNFYILNSLGFAFTNINDIIDSECLLSIPEDPFIHYNRNLPSITSNIRRYYLRLLDGNNIETDTVRYVLMGGTANKIWLTFQLLQNISKNNSFLTLQPNAKRIDRNGIEFISWFNYTGDTQHIEIHVSTYIGATLSGTFVPQGTDISVLSGMCVTIPIHPTALGIANDITHYYYVIKNQAGDELSPKRLLIIEDSKSRYLAYLNAYGCPEIASCSGDLTTKITITSESWNTIRNIQSGATIIKNERIAAKIERKYTYRSGYINAKQKEAYSELAISSRVFDVTTSQYFGLVLTDAKTEEIISDSSPKNYSWEWTFNPTIDETNFSLDEDLKSTANLQEPPQFPQGIGNATGISTGLKSFHITEAEFLDLIANEKLLEGIYFLTDTDPEEVWFSGGGNTAVNITFGPLRYVKIDPLTGATAFLEGISTTNEEQRKRMRFYRGNAQIFIDEDFSILPNDVIQFFLPFDNETFRAFY